LWPLRQCWQCLVASQPVGRCPVAWHPALVALQSCVLLHCCLCWQRPAALQFAGQPAEMAEVGAAESAAAALLLSMVVLVVVAVVLLLLMMIKRVVVVVVAMGQRGAGVYVADPGCEQRHD